VLARQTIREMLFLILETPQRQWLRCAAEGQSGRLSHVLREINDNFTQRVPVARLAGMSVPTFHASFKAATNNTPLQYMKALRLTRAVLPGLLQRPNELLRPAGYARSYARGDAAEGRFATRFDYLGSSGPGHARVWQEHET
jgi:methylphosphotriester-DNA--protein-cysteine methyltransferase